MSKKRILSFILAALMVVSVLPMTAGAEVAEEYVPEPLTLSPAVTDTYIVNEDFSGDTFFSELIKGRPEDRVSLTIEDEKLKVTCNEAGKSTFGAKIFLDKTYTTKFSELLAVEFTMELTDEDDIIQFKTEGDGVSGTQNYWRQGGEIMVKTPSAENRLGNITGTKAKFTLLFNPANDRQSIRVESLTNPSEVIEIRDYAALGDLSSCYHIDLFREASTTVGMYFYIDDLKVYKPNAPDYEAVLWDKEWLTEDEITGSQGNYNLSGTLDLPKTGEYGSTITWVSSDTNIITNDGVITNPGDDATVTLTATITKGSETATKSLEFKFGEVAYLSPAPAVAGEYIVNEDFSGDIFSRLITPRTDVMADLSIDNGRLKISYKDNTESKGTFGIRIYLDNTQTTKFTELTAVEFTVERPTADYPFTFKTEGTGVNGLYNEWREGGRVRLNFADNNYDDLGNVNTTKAKFTILMNPELNKQSVRVEGLDDSGAVVELRDYNMHAGGLKNTNHLDLFLNATYATNLGKSFYIDDLKIYKAKAPGTEAVAWDAEVFGEGDFLGTQTAGSVKADLTLPATGKYGSNITWVSSDESIITNDGKVKRGATAKEVKLTATFAKGIAESETKEFTLTVAPGEFTVGDISYEGTGYENGALKAGKVKVVLPVHSSLERIKGVTVVSAVYDKDTKELLSVISEPLSFEEGYDQASGIELTIEKETNYIKTFVWNSLSDLTPLTTVFSLGE